MTFLAIFLGIYSYIIFFLGVFGFLYKPVILLVSVISVVIAVIFNFHPKSTSFSEVAQFTIFNQNIIQKIKKNLLSFSKLDLVLVILVLVQIFINLIGVLGPELAFDALWYHLTLPKLFLQFHKIVYIPGGLFNYSVMPKLGEMYYITSLALGNETVAKVVHFVFGILMCIALYRLSRRFMNQTLSLLAVVIFYSNLVIDWMSITAYTDLIRGFFELTSLLVFLDWVKSRKYAHLVISALLLGFAITAKVLAVGSLLIFILMIVVCLLRQKENSLSIAKHILSFSLIALLVPLPWFIFAYVHTGNPLFPIFSSGFGVGISHQLFNPSFFVQSLWMLFTHAADPISPVYIAFAPLAIFVGIIRVFPLTFHSSPHGRGKIFGGKKLFHNLLVDPNNFRLLIVYSVVSLVVWYVTPDTGGGRFIIPYLPAYSLLVASVFTFSFPQWFQKSLYTFIIAVALISIGYRGIANKRYLPVILGIQTPSEFLTKHLNFSFGDFYDTDGFFKNHIKQSDLVLLYGFHNEYYVDFPFIDSSFVQKRDRFNYIAVQHGGIPKRFYNWQKIYHNTKTDVSLYQSPNKQWIRY